MRSLLSLCFVAACGVGPSTDTPPGSTDMDCSQSYLTYQNFGAVFIANWCRGCHSAGLPGDMRQMAPADVNFDTQPEVQKWSDGIVSLAGGDPNSMPPAGGPSDDERKLLTEWIGCGAP